MIARKPFIDVTLVYLLLFVSGTILYKQASDTYLILGFLASVLAWALFSDRKINEKFILYVSIFTGFLLIIHLYTGGSLSIGTVIGSTMKLVLAYLVLKAVGENFTDTYIRVVVVLAGFSLFGYLTDQLHLFDALIRKLPQVGNNGYEGILYVYRYRYAGYDRNNSIFFEPGAYQAFLNAALFLLFFAKTEISGSKRWVYTILLLAALLTTFSTTGFLIFAAMFGLILLKSSMISASSKAVFLGTLLVVIAVFGAQFRHVILGKIENYMSIQDVTDNENRRSFDLIVDLEIIKRHQFGIGQRKYNEIFSVTGYVREGSTSSNGITKLLAIYGLPFSLFYFGSFYWAFRKLLKETGLLMTIIPFGMFLMFLVGESYYLFEPVSLAIIAAVFVYDRLPHAEGMAHDTEVA